MPPQPLCRSRRLALAWRLAVLCSLSACFAMIREPQRHFWLLHVSPQSPASSTDVRSLDALIRVRDLDTGSAYDKFQMVVRSSPYELGYRQRDVWAVKPGRMVSDLLARALQERGLFAAVSRELGERRPDYLLAGDLHAIEIEQLTPTWQAHIAFSLQVSDADTGDILWAGNVDERQPCRLHSYSEGVEALSAALDRGLHSALNAFAQARAAGRGRAVGGPPSPPRPAALPGGTPVPIGEPLVPQPPH